MTISSVNSAAIPHQKNSLMLDFLSLTKPRLSSLVIFTSALGLFLTPSEIDFIKAIITIFATSGLVGGACAINCYIEREVDALMERTKDRPLPAGRISANQALFFGLSLVFLCSVLLFYFVNLLTGVLGLVAAVIYVCMYTPLKKKTSMALFVGAIPGAIPPLMGWTSVTNSFGTLGLVLFGILFIWQLPHFLSISIYHARDYNNAQIKILPSYLGMRRTIHRIVLYTFALFVVSLIPYYIGSATEGYRNLMLLLGGTFFVFSTLGYKFKDDSQEMREWARKYFYGSLLYLPCVFILMIVFK